MCVLCVILELVINGTDKCVYTGRFYTDIGVRYDKCHAGERMIERDLKKLSRTELIALYSEQDKELIKVREQFDFVTSILDQEHLKYLQLSKELACFSQEAKELISETFMIKAEYEAVLEALKEVRELNKESKAVVNMEIGSLTEASKRVNVIFEEAQKQADDFLKEKERLWQKKEAEIKAFEKESIRVIGRLMQEAKDKCQSLKQAVDEKCRLQSEEVVERMNHIEKAMKIRCEQLENEVSNRLRDQIEQIDGDILYKRESKLSKTKAECDDMVEDARIRSEAYWEEVSGLLEQFYKEHEQLKSLVPFLDF